MSRARVVSAYRSESTTTEQTLQDLGGYERPRDCTAWLPSDEAPRPCWCISKPNKRILIGLMIGTILTETGDICLVKGFHLTNLLVMIDGYRPLLDSNVSAEGSKELRDERRTAFCQLFRRSVIQKDPIVKEDRKGVCSCYLSDQNHPC